MEKTYSIENAQNIVDTLNEVIGYAQNLGINIIMPSQKNSQEMSQPHFEIIVDEETKNPKEHFCIGCFSQDLFEE